MKQWFAYLSVCLVSVQAVSAREYTPWIYRDFDAGMRVHAYPKAKAVTKHIVGIDGDELYRFFKQLYAKNNLNQLSKLGLSLEEKIPRIIHQIWIGGPLPEAFKKLCESWKFYHRNRGWMYKIWTDEDVSKMRLHNQEFYDATDNPGVRSDILKWEVIYNFGGFYLDVDFECLKPLDSLLCYDFVTALQPLDTQFVQLGAALYGARPHHPILEDCIATVKDDWHHKGAPKKTGPVHFTKSFYRTAGKDGSIDIALPASYAYPLGCQEKDMQYDKWLEEGAYAIHHWAKSWMPSHYRFEQFKRLNNDKECASWND